MMPVEMYKLIALFCAYVFFWFYGY